MDTQYRALRFKLILLPIWIATYLYGPRTYQVLVNANTGEVIGERPWSKLKLTVLIVLILAIAAAVAVIVAMR